MNDLLCEPLASLNTIALTKEILSNQTVNLQITGVIDTGLSHVISSISEKNNFNIIVSFNETKARELYENLKYYIPDVLYYPPKDFIFYNADISGNSTVAERIKVIQAIKNKRATIVTTGSGLMDKLIPYKTMSDESFTIDMTSIIELDALTIKLVSMGFTRVEEVSGPGEFSIRGSIIDVFPLTSDIPYRIDLFDNEVDSIKTFDLESQRAIENVDSVNLLPASEYVLSEDNIAAGITAIKKDLDAYEQGLRKDMKTEAAHRISTITNDFISQLEISKDFVSLDSYIEYFYKETSSLIEYLGDSAIYYIDETPRVKEHMDAVFTEFKESMILRLEQGYLLPKQTDMLYTPDTIYAVLNQKKVIHFTALDQKLKAFNIKDTFSISMRNISSFNKNIEILIKDLKKYKKNGYKVLIVSPSKTRGMRFCDSLNNDYDINSFYSAKKDTPLKPGEIMVSYGNLHAGYEFPEIKFAVISESDIFGAKKPKKKHKKSSYSGEKIASFSSLSIGDYVVHESHGVGIYKGIEKMIIDKIEKDYIKIEYDKGNNLYIPTTSLDMIQKFAGSEARRPKLNKLGSKEWNTTKTRVKSAVRDIAADLVKLYAKRQGKNGYQFSPDTLWQKEFEEMFPYDETSDQLSAIEDTKKDMESTKIMDRLICGDVGYGKTEIAIRAAFKAVQDGKQVVILAPTTILAGQHYNNFVGRMKDYPIVVELLSRFKSPAAQKKTIEEISRGMVDIVIGTHRVLSKDINFPKLGLLIIDEEQRFGVAHKEKLKQLKENVDVLALSATPIPRTLHMSLVGIRDMSVLEEPPVDRMPIQTFVMEYNPIMVKEAIARELARGGQVYYVYNRVSNIEEITIELRKLMPDVTIEYAHGQMPEKKLEQVMYDFINGEIDVLVSTTIIETGLDISNANTMIIHDADKLGLSQLYQLRGRIGRSSRTAYAFLMYRRDKMLKEVAEKRLMAIREFTDLGSGFKIAMRDLEIRGAGNVLGAEQSGHMEAVGYDLYCKMLGEAVKYMKGEIKEQEDFETVVDLNVDAFIPSRYIKNELQKLNIYKKIATIESLSEYEDMEDELMDRFGDPPKSVMNLLDIALLKASAHAAFISEISGDKNCLTLKIYSKAPINALKLPSFIEKHKRVLKFEAGATPKFIYKPHRPFKDVPSLKKELSEFFVNMSEIIDNT